MASKPMRHRWQMKRGVVRCIRRKCNATKSKGIVYGGPCRVKVRDGEV